MKRTFAYDKKLDKVVETTGQIKEIEKKRFHIGGQSGFKWVKKSLNKTWIENGDIKKYREGGSITN
jgi:hypothetical protein